jgi:glutamate-1-semialdehyde 2,1-aminomutase
MARRTDTSEAAFAEAREVLVGGVNSPVRAFAAVGGAPPVIAAAEGAYVTDVDGNRYVDYVGAYGPAILGHAAPAVVEAVHQAARRGIAFGAPTRLETRLAGHILRAFPAAGKVRFVSSGTEAVMTAVRLARGATGRDRVVKCAGCYHGHADALLVAAGSGATTLGVPSSAGVPRGATADTLVVPFNDLAAMRQAFDDGGGRFAAVLVEPVAGNMGVVPPAEGYLAGLRRLCDDNGSVLVFDEVMTGFRVAAGGAQELYGVRADLTTLGKIIGGGLPVGAVAGREQIMRHLAPAGGVYQAGTLSGGPVAMAAGLAALEALRADGFYESLERTAAALEQGLLAAAGDAGLGGKVALNRVGSMLCCFFRPPPVADYADATSSNAAAYAAFFHAMLDAGVYLPPSQYEAMFVSAAHRPAEIEHTLAAAQHAFRAAARVMRKPEGERR